VRENQGRMMASRGPRLAERSGAIAALLSFIFPGLGQAYLRHRRTALTFGVPVLVLVVAVVVWVGASGLTRAGLKLLDPTIALLAGVVVLAVGLWWIAGIINAWRAGTRLPGVAVLVPFVLVCVVGAATLYGADWMYRLSVADRAFNDSPDVTLGDNTSPSPLNSAIAEVPTASGAPQQSVTPMPTSPDYNDYGQDATEPPATIEPGPSPTFDITKIDAQDDGWLNVLVLGIDTRCAGGPVTGANSDTMIVVSANAATGQVYMFSFPRDIAKFPLYVGGTMPGYWKLNSFAGFTKSAPSVFPEPGQPSLAYEIGYLLGVPIDYYASINICGFPQLIDTLGGVDVCNSKTIDDPGYPWGDGTFGFTLDPGEYHFDGRTALAYARTRHGSSDFARAKRQQQLLSAIRQAIMQPQNLARLPDIVTAMGSVVHTNFPLDQIDQLMSLANRLESAPTAEYVFSFPEWAQHLPRSLTNGRSVEFLRLDKVAALSEQIFGAKSLYTIGGAVPSTRPFDLPTPSPTPSEGANVC
jgi:LCP family protein required for cell wall assembly